MAFTYYYVSIDDTSEICYYLEYNGELDFDILCQVLGDLQPTSTVPNAIEIGPKMSFHTSWCSNAVNILHKCGLTGIKRIEKSYRIGGVQPQYDPMTEEHYPRPLESFTLGNIDPEPVYTVAVADLDKFNADYNLGWDAADIAYYSSLFTKRNPTNVELIDIAQSNSEHSRHHFFGGLHVIDGVRMPETLFQMIKKPLGSTSNSVLAFCDNASAIRGYPVKELITRPERLGYKFVERTIVQHPTFTAETHNFPTGIAPFPGAATGVGGRIRDTIAIGRGGRMIAGTAGYCVASQQLLIQASNGASDYGNKIGEPIIQGFTRFFDMTVAQERWAWLKPIMFSGGIGLVADKDLHKGDPDAGLAIVRIGGPAYRIGVGGSTASSAEQDEQQKNLNAVQRGDPEMENRVCSVIRALIEEERNPIISIHDQGAGGTANVTKEIVYPIGGIVDIRNITSGDPTLTTLEKWIAEYQEQVTILVKQEDVELVQQVAKRENVDAVIFGQTSRDGIIRVRDASGEPVCLELSKIFNTPHKVYEDRRELPLCSDLVHVNTLDFWELLQQVLHLESVGSKRFLTNKVDRSVTGLIAQQQCVGPFHTPISDYALVAHSFTAPSGTATAIGEQPIKAFVSPAASGRLSVIEMLTNMVWVKVSALEDIKCSVNWMWPAKLPGENAAMYDCMQALSDYMLAVGIAADGGKDSVSMYTRQNKDTVIKSPRSVVVSGYVTVPDIQCRVTPELKGGGALYHLPLCSGVSLGGSALAQALGELGAEVHTPEPEYLRTVFNVIQEFIVSGWISAGHDVSDGGLIGCICEMLLASDLETIQLKAMSNESAFSETSGVVIEIPHQHLAVVQARLQAAEIEYVDLQGEDLVLHANEIRGWWEQVSREYDTQQVGAELADSEWNYLVAGQFPTWHVPSTIVALPIIRGPVIRVAVLSDEGSNGSREMAAVFHAAGFEVWDVTMTDLLNEPRLLDQFRGIAFVGGFTYADVFGAGTGWAAQIKHHPGLARAFGHFKERTDTFSFGVCNGCQLMSQLGWVPECQFKQNYSKRYESRLATVRVNNSASIMLRGMQDLQYGIWVAHGEGRFVGEVFDQCIAMQYVGVDGKPTEEYPLNPSGSVAGITGVCSTDGRHLAMMPHPERCWLEWQMPWTLVGIHKNTHSPWFKMFTNAYEWCLID